MFHFFLKMTLICFMQIMARGHFLFLCNPKVRLLISQIWRTNTSNYDAQGAELKLLFDIFKCFCYDWQFYQICGNSSLPVLRNNWPIRRIRQVQHLYGQSQPKKITELYTNIKAHSEGDPLWVALQCMKRTDFYLPWVCGWENACVHHITSSLVT